MHQATPPDTIGILVYNVAGLKNKRNENSFINFVSSYDIFALVETHVEEQNIVSYGNMFSEFKLSWVPATRQNKSGRASGGIVCGLKLLSSIAKNAHFHLMDDIISVNVKIKEYTFKFVPIYLRPSDWIRELIRLINILQNTVGKML